VKLVDRIAEARTIGGVPWEPWRNPYWKFNIGGPVHPSRQVTGVDSVVQLAALYAAVRVISDGVASLPLQSYRKDPSGSPQLMPNGPLLDSPSVIDTPYDWLFKCMTSLLLQGNAWGLITTRSGITAPTGLGYPTTVEWLPPQDISVEDDQQQPYNPLRTRVYYLGRLMDRDQLVHVKAFSVAGRTEAVSPMRAFMHLIGQGKEALDYSYNWFHNGGFPPSTFQNLAEEVSEEQAKTIRRRLTDTLRSHEPLVFGRDWDWKPVVVPQNEATFIQAMQLNAAQIAAIYGVPPERIGGLRGSSLTYSTQEQETLSLIVDTLRPWLVRLEQAFNPLLPSTQFCKFNADEMLKTDLKTRHQIYQVDRQMGFRTVDELRQLDNLGPLDHNIGQDPLPLELSVAMARTTRAVSKDVGKFVQVLEPVQWHGTVTGQLPAKGEQINPAATPEKILPGPAPAGTGGGAGGAGAGGASQTGEAPTTASGGSSGGGGDDEAQEPGTTFVTEGGRPVPIQHSREPGAETRTWGPAFEPAPVEWRQFGPPPIKASNTERDLACRMLLQHKADGRLLDDEFAERAAAAAKARTRGQLDVLFSDLPVMRGPFEPPVETRPEPRHLPGSDALAQLELRDLSEDDEVARRQLLVTTNGRVH
jgi:HK97 family phage portal protein